MWRILHPGGIITEISHLEPINTYTSPSPVVQRETPPFIFAFPIYRRDCLFGFQMTFPRKDRRGNISFGIFFRYINTLPGSSDATTNAVMLSYRGSQLPARFRAFYLRCAVYLGRSLRVIARDWNKRPNLCSERAIVFAR